LTLSLCVSLMQTWIEYRPGGPPAASPGKVVPELPNAERKYELSLRLT